MKDGHKGKNISIKKANIDVGMVSTIKWLNSLYGVNTEFCCEGGEPTLNDKPYVLFYCNNIGSLAKIADVINKINMNTTTPLKCKDYENVDYGNIDIQNYNGYLRFRLCFRDVETFKEWKIFMGFGE